MIDINCYVIHRFMLTKLKLKGTQLNIYAVIYEFSLDGRNGYEGSIKYLCEMCGGVSKPTVINALKELTDKHYIIRCETDVNGVTFIKYSVNFELVEDMMCGKEISPVGKSGTKTDKEKPLKHEYDELLSTIEDEELRGLYADYIQMRKFIKAPMTERAVSLLIKKVNKLESDIDRQKLMLETAIESNWKSVYPIKGYGEPVKEKKVEGWLKDKVVTV